MLFENVMAGVISGILTAGVIALATWLIVRYRNRAQWRLSPEFGNRWVLENLTNRTLDDVTVIVTAWDHTSRPEPREGPVGPHALYGVGFLEVRDSVTVIWRDGKRNGVATARIIDGVYEYRLRGSRPVH